LSNFDRVSIRVAHVAPQFRCMDFWLCNEFRASRSPKVVTVSDVGHAKIQKNAQHVVISRRRSDDFRLIVGRTAADVDRKPNIAKPQKSWLALEQHRSTEDVTIERD